MRAAQRVAADRIARLAGWPADQRPLTLHPMGVRQPPARFARANEIALRTCAIDDPANAQRSQFAGPARTPLDIDRAPRRRSADQLPRQDVELSVLTQADGGEYPTMP